MRRRRIVLRCGIALGAAIAVTACSRGGDGAIAEPAGTPAPADVVTLPVVTDSPTVPETAAPSASDAPDALRFSAPLVGGGRLDLASLADKPVLMWFWAPY